MNQHTDTVHALVEFGQRVRSRLAERLDWLESRDRSEDTTEQFIYVWSIALFTLSWDLSDSIFALAFAGNHVRAIHILSRSLFEYATRLEHYAHYPNAAVTHGSNAVAFVADILQAKRDMFDLENETPERRAYLIDMFGADSKVVHAQFRQMLEQNYKARGFSDTDISRSIATQYKDFYAVASALSHGSQGAFFDIYYKTTEGSFDVRRKPEETDLIDVLRNVIGFLLRLNYGFSKHFAGFSDTDLREEFQARFG